MGLRERFEEILDLNTPRRQEDYREQTEKRLIKNTPSALLAAVCEEEGHIQKTMKFYEGEGAITGQGPYEEEPTGPCLRCGEEKP